MIICVDSIMNELENICTVLHYETQLRGNDLKQTYLIRPVCQPNLLSDNTEVDNIYWNKSYFLCKQIKHMFYSHK